MSVATNQNAVFGVSAGLMPKRGPKVLIVPVDLTGGATFIDLVTEIMNDEIEFIQSVYIDNTANNFALTLICRVTGQKIIVAPFCQGIFTILSVSSTQFDVSGPVATFKFIFCNMPLAPYQEFSTTQAPLAGNSTQRNTSASTGSVTIMPQNRSRKGYSLYNDSTSICYVLEGGSGVASLTNFSFILSAGSMFAQGAYYSSSTWGGVVSAIWVAANGAMRSTEYST